MIYSKKIEKKIIRNNLADRLYLWYAAGDFRNFIRGTRRFRLLAISDPWEGGKKYYVICWKYKQLIKIKYDKTKLEKYKRMIDYLNYLTLSF